MRYQYVITQEGDTVSVGDDVAGARLNYIEHVARRSNGIVVLLGFTDGETGMPDTLTDLVKDAGR